MFSCILEIDDKLDDRQRCHLEIMGVLTEEILGSLADLAFHPYKVVYGCVPKEYCRNSRQVALSRLERNGHIERGVLEDEVCFRLTQLGIDKLKNLEQRKKEKMIVSNIPVKETKWDGKWRVVIFDVPELNRRIRNALRETLKLLEFQPIQRSVWISKKDYTKELRAWFRELGISSFALAFETEDLGIIGK